MSGARVLSWAYVMTPKDATLGRLQFLSLGSPFGKITVRKHPDSCTPVVHRSPSTTGGSCEVLRHICIVELGQQIGTLGGDCDGILDPEGAPG